MSPNSDQKLSPHVRGCASARLLCVFSCRNTTQSGGALGIASCMGQWPRGKGDVSGKFHTAKTVTVCIHGGLTLTHTTLHQLNICTCRLCGSCSHRRQTATRDATHRLQQGNPCTVQRRKGQAIDTYPLGTPSPRFVSHGLSHLCNCSGWAQYHMW